MTRLYKTIDLYTAENDGLRQLVASLTDEINGLRARLHLSERRCETLVQVAALGMLNRPEIAENLPESDGAPAALVVLEGCRRCSNSPAARRRNSPPTGLQLLVLAYFTSVRSRV